MSKTTISQWNISAGVYDEKLQAFYESVFCQGNGYIGARGMPPVDKRLKADESGNYIAGFFEYIKDSITDMVNLPDWFSTAISINGYEIDGAHGAVSDFKIDFDLAKGVVNRSYLYTDLCGRVVKIEQSRFISWSNKHLGALRVKVTPLNGEIELEVVSGINAHVANRPISDNQMGENKDVLNLFGMPSICGNGQSGSIETTTKRSNREIFESYELSVSGADYSLKNANSSYYVGGSISAKLCKDQTLTIDKFVSIFSYRDCLKDCLQVASEVAKKACANGFDKELELSADNLRKKWEICDVEIGGNVDLQGAIRYNILQLLMTNDGDDGRVSIGARGIMHGRYKGCYFWDTEIFMLPFYLYTFPQAAKNLLMYRYNTLPDAKTSAGWFSLEGARYSWMCSDSGFEQCETWDTGCCEIHITADIAYAVRHYYEITRDVDFLCDYGCEILLETARYWVSRFTYNKAADKYNLLFVKGPDEYCGVTTNNTYTNYLARYNLSSAIHCLELLQKTDVAKYNALITKTNLREEELNAWRYMINRIVINYDQKQDLFIQDDTFEKLEPLDIPKYKTDDQPLYRKLSFDRLQRYKVLKQGDLVMLMLMLPQDFTIEQKRNVWEYYEPLTLHDSTLSFGAHAELGAQLDELKKADKYFYKSMFLDLFDVMGNTATEGVHTASFGQAWQALILGYCGFAVIDGKPTITQHLPNNIQSVKFKAIVGKKLYAFEVSKEKQIITQID